MKPAELRRAAREAEAAGDYHTAHQLREADTTPAPVIPVVAIDLEAMSDVDLEQLAECVAQEMVRRARDDDPQKMEVR